LSRLERRRETLAPGESLRWQWPIVGAPGALPASATAIVTAVNARAVTSTTGAGSQAGSQPPAELGGPQQPELIR